MSNLIKEAALLKPESTARMKSMMDVLCGISTKVRIDWSGDKTHLYSILGAVDEIEGFCSYYIDNDIWEQHPAEGSFIFYDGKKYLEGMKHWDSEQDQNWRLERRKDRDLFHSMSITCGDLRVPFISAYSTDVMKIDAEMMERQLYLEDSFELILSSEQLKRIKKLLRSNSLKQTTNAKEDKIRISVFEDKIKMESGWELTFDVGQQDLREGDYSFDGKYLKSLDDSNDISLNIHDTYVTVRMGQDSCYMFPQDITI